MDEVTTTEVDDSADSKQKSLSVEIARLFSFSNQQNQDKTSLRISVWSGKIGLEFNKIMPDNKFKKAFTTIDYEKAIFLNGLLLSILHDRFSSFKSGTPYREFDIPIEQSYPDKDGSGLRKIGTLNIKTKKVSNDKGDEAARVVISFDTAGETYDVILCSRIISKQIPEKYTSRNIDPDDARFMYFCKTFESIINNIPTIAYLNRMVELIMGGNNKFNKDSGGSQKQISSVNAERINDNTPPTQRTSFQRTAVTDNVERIAF